MEPEAPEIPVPTPDELVMLHAFTHGCCVVVGVRHRNVRDDLVAENASGVLVRFGHRNFVFTAGHIVDGRTTTEVAVHFPRKVYVARKTGESIRRITCSRHPDVAVIELDSADARAWQHMTPSEPDAVLAWHHVGEREPIGIFGLPVALQVPSKEAARPGTMSLSAGGMCAVTVIQRGVVNEHDPGGGHGFYVFLDRVEEIYSDRARRIEPDGMSGGPVFTVERGRPPLLVGLIRAKLHARYIWCEPIGYAIELLLGHDEAPVVADARKALATLGLRSA